MIIDHVVVREQKLFHARLFNVVVTLRVGGDAHKCIDVRVMINSWRTSWNPRVIKWGRVWHRDIFFPFLSSDGPMKVVYREIEARGELEVRLDKY